jgi:hypothetical protein
MPSYPHRWTKGGKIKKELIGLLKQSLNIHVALNEWQAEDGGPDLVGLPVSITVKPYKLRWLSSWWKRTVIQASQTVQPPILAYKKSGKPWRFRIVSSDYMPECGSHPREWDFTVDVGVEIFIPWLKGLIVSVSSTRSAHAQLYP